MAKKNTGEVTVKVVKTNPHGRPGDLVTFAERTHRVNHLIKAGVLAVVETVEEPSDGEPQPQD